MNKFVCFLNSLKSSRKNLGVSMAEVVIVIAIVALLTALGFNRFSSIRSRQSVETAAADIVTTLNRASSQTLASVNSSNYGVHFESGAIVIFTGTSYPGSLTASGNEAYTTIVSPASITNVTLNGVSGTSGEMYFNRLTGIPSKTGTVTVTANNFSRTITIGATGNISIN